MGMFDWVRYEMECPACNHKIINFQSKDRNCWMDHLEYWEVENFYSSCDYCGTWIEFDLKTKGKIKPITDYEMKVYIQCNCEVKKRCIPQRKCPIHDLNYNPDNCPMKEGKK